MDTNIRICKYCNLSFNVIGNVFSNHVRWCNDNPKRNDTENIKLAVIARYAKELGQIKEFMVPCHKCKKIITVSEHEKKHPRKEKYFCSLKCSNTRIVTNEVKIKISETLAGRIVGGKKGRKKAIIEKRICLECNKEYQTAKPSQKYCSILCRKKHNKTSNDYLYYKGKCKFKFNVWLYPEKFDLDLIRCFGWYKATNNGNNLGGISRDHKISIKYGWENGILPYIIAHPANCELMIHNQNISKNKKCSIILEKLLNDINLWEHSSPC